MTAEKREYLGPAKEVHPGVTFRPTKPQEPNSSSGELTFSAGRDPAQGASLLHEGKATYKLVEGEIHIISWTNEGEQKAIMEHGEPIVINRGDIFVFGGSGVISVVNIPPVTDATYDVVPTIRRRKQ